MFNCKEEKCLDENCFSSIVASSLRNVIEKSVADVVLPYRILSLTHLSSWKTFQNDLIQMLKRNSNMDQRNNQDFFLFNHFDRYAKQHQQEDKDFSFEYLMNYNIDIICIESDFDRLRQLM